MITIPFDLELAKKINNGERNGMIVTDGDNYRVEFVYHREESFPILGVIHTDHGIISDWLSNNGFGEKNYRLKLKVPEYTTFKDGDVLSNEQGDYLFILNTNGEYLTSFHASWKKGRGVVIPRKAHADCNNIEKYRLATEDERQKFIDALKTSKEPKAKMCLKQFFGIEIEPEYKFKPFDKVLVRDTEDDDWHVSLFVRKIADAQYKEERYECLNRIMEAAKLIANSSAALIQAIGMMSENIERANRGESLAYTEDQFMKLIQDNGITYNDVIQRGWI